MKALSIVCVVFLSLNVQGQWDTNMLPGRTVMTHLFEWKWDDIAFECENWLGPKGYGGVQISPPNEHVLIYQEGGAKRPWYERYQPVSYVIQTRSGDENQFKNMVQRCNDAGVRIYVDVVVNHMTGGWPLGNPSTGSSGFDYANENYPGVPYSGFDFNDWRCKTSSGSIENYNDAEQVRNCRLLGMVDLDQGNPYVRERIRDYLNKLTSMGVAGFRFDASKHMWPGDMKAIIDSLDDLPTQWFNNGSRPLVYQEVIDLGMGEPITNDQYIGVGRVTEFKYGMELGKAFWGHNDLHWLVNWGEGWGLLDRNYALAFIDNHDNQRGHGGAGGYILTYRQTMSYKSATAFMLAHPYGVARVMSSYDWPQNIINGHDQNDWYGPPSDPGWSILSPTFNEDGTCGNGWVCEHRWNAIANMVGFRNTVLGTGIQNWWDNGSNQIAFCRGNKGFLAINNDPWNMQETLQTCLPAGTYCDVISGKKWSPGTCTGKVVEVSADGTAYIELLWGEDISAFAIYIGSKA